MIYVDGGNSRNLLAGVDLESRLRKISGIMVAHSFGNSGPGFDSRAFGVWPMSVISCSALTMLPTLSISLARPLVSIDSRPGFLPGVPALHGQGALLPTALMSSCRDTSAAARGVAVARSRVSVHVAFMFVQSPDGHRGEPCGSSENHLRQRFLSRELGRLAIGSESTIAGREATRFFTGSILQRCTASHFHSARRQPSVLPPPAAQGGPPNQERSRLYEERNVGQCLAARGVPHRHR